MTVDFARKTLHSNASLVLFVLLLAGCGGGGGGGDERADSSARQSAPDRGGPPDQPAAPSAIAEVMPFLAGTGELGVLDPRQPVDENGQDTRNPLFVDRGLAPPPPGAGCDHCFPQSRVIYDAEVSRTGFTNPVRSRLVYVKRGESDAAGGEIFKIDLTAQERARTPVRISAIEDGCAVVPSKTRDFSAIDNSVVVIERAGPDRNCDSAKDNVATALRLDADETDAGLELPLLLETGNPLHARIDEEGAIVGFVSFEGTSDEPVLVQRNANLGQPATLLELEAQQTLAANLTRSDPAHLFVTATPAADGLKLFRIEGDGSLSPVLHHFMGFNVGNPIQDGQRDATHLYLRDAGQLVRVDLDATEAASEVLATMPPGLRIGRFFLDTSTTPGQIVFEANDDAFTTAGGVFTAATDGMDSPPTVLAHRPDSQGGTAEIAAVGHGRAYINVAHHAGSQDAILVSTDGSGLATTPDAYWAGFSRARAFDAATFSLPMAHVFMVTRLLNDQGVGIDTLMAVNPQTAEFEHVLGSVAGGQAFHAIHVSGIGRFAFARIAIDRFGAIDSDLYALDATAEDSLTAVAVTESANDIPLDMS